MTKRIEAEDDRLKLTNDIRNGLFQALAGLAVLIGAFIAWQQLQSDRVQLQSDRTQSQITNTLATEGQNSQAFSEEASQLGSHQIYVKIAAIYGLQELLNPPGHNPNAVPTNPVYIAIRTAVLDTLNGYVQTQVPLRTGSNGSNSCNASMSEAPMSVRHPDVQAALDVLGGRGFNAHNESDLFLRRTDLSKASLIGDFDGTDFTNADLAGADFNQASIDKVKFTDADLCGANLAHVTNYDTAVFQGAMVDGQTVFPKGFHLRGIRLEKGQ